jgi:hypothetical protein
VCQRDGDRVLATTFKKEEERGGVAAAAAGVPTRGEPIGEIGEIADSTVVIFITQHKHACTDTEQIVCFVAHFSSPPHIYMHNECIFQFICV